MLFACLEKTDAIQFMQKKKEDRSMNGMKKVEETLSSSVNRLAVKLVEHSANSACAWAIHQPEFPSEAKRFKKYQK